jgi:hypothetical protein
MALLLGLVMIILLKEVVVTLVVREQVPHGLRRVLALLVAIAQAVVVIVAVVAVAVVEIAVVAAAVGVVIK